MTVELAIKELKSLLSSGLNLSEVDSKLHGRSETHFENCIPDAVAYVNCRNEVEELVRICDRHECPIIGWGTGTSFEGHTAALRGGV